MTRIEEMPPEQHGHSVIYQSAFGLVSIKSSIISDKDGADLGGVNILATVIAENGTTLYTVYKMTSFPEDNLKEYEAKAMALARSM